MPRAIGPSVADVTACQCAIKELIERHGFAAVIEAIDALSENGSAPTTANKKLERMQDAINAAISILNAAISILEDA